MADAIGSVKSTDAPTSTRERKQPKTTCIVNMNKTSSQILLVPLIVLAVAVSVVEATFTLGVRDSFMIAHSFHQHPSFGPAGGMHGATYTCDVEFISEYLDKECNWVIDIGKASDMLTEVLAKYNYKNLDDLFPDGELTTTEFMARQIHTDVCERLRDEYPEFSGDLCVKLWESHKAWASYRGAVAA